MENEFLINKNDEVNLNKENELGLAYDFVKSFVKKNYLSELTNLEVIPLSNEISNCNIRDTYRFFKVTKIVYDKEEDNLDKLSNVYNALDDNYSSLIMILDSSKNGVNLYLGVRVDDENEHPTLYKHILKKSFKGNFPGSNLENLSNSKMEKMINNITNSRFTNKEKVISSVSGIPSLMNEDKEKFVQGIEKLIDAMQGEIYSAVFIADTVSSKEVELIQEGYENIYSQLFPFSKSNFSYSENESESVTEGITKGFTETVNKNITKTQTKTKGLSLSEGKTKGKSKSHGGNASVILLGYNHSRTSNESYNSNETKNINFASGESETKGSSESKNNQENYSESHSKANTKGIQINFEDKKVTNLLSEIDEQLKRLKESRDFGLWNSACYFLGDDKQTVSIASSTYRSLMRGENSSLENSYINIWDQSNTKKELQEIKKYIQKFQHPLMKINSKGDLISQIVDPGSLISGKELTIQMGLPTKSVNGITVLESAEFGRNIITHNMSDRIGKKIELGNIFHMGKNENTRAKLDLKSLRSHTFITGSTGSGKSNTIYKLLDEFRNNDLNFLVIEPAKGEYKEVFGGLDDVNVYGTNPQITPLLRINPFRFPENIHVFEHIDRLIEIFNACWPMYAAMPAVLKEGIELAYQSIGWDLDNSIYLGEEIKYPTLKVLLNILPQVINKTSYSAEVKNNYTGALVTRVRSLTNGLTGKIFTTNELKKEKIFSENCIIDLSRIGSMETKSLLMGILFMRLSEDRYANADKANSELKHITVLEEAHHLLKKTSTEQSQENSNLQGKSVEMISNSIAEMRTYGEGFIIADQSPDLLDSSVIKNTNTKIIMKLPDENDRQIVGKSANLNDNQINEISKFQTGVAAIYQNNWLQPILCKIDEYKKKNKLNYKAKINFDIESKHKRTLFKLLLSPQSNEKIDLDLSDNDFMNLKTWLFGSKLSEKGKKILAKNIDQYKNFKEMDLWQKENISILSSIVNSFINSNILLNYANNIDNITDWTNEIRIGLRNYIDLDENKKLENTLIKLLLHNFAEKNADMKNFYFNWVEKVERSDLY
jgi:hypothetical protein